MTFKFKQANIRKCIGCGEGVMHDNNLTFYAVLIQPAVINLPALQRQHGLEMTMGQSAILAQIMGPDEDMAKPLCKLMTVWVCAQCANKPLEELADAASAKGDGL